MTDTFWIAFGSLATGAGVVIALFVFFVGERDKIRDEERKQFYRERFNFEDRIDKDFKDLKMRVDQVFLVTSQLNLTLELQKEKLGTVVDKFSEYVKDQKQIIARLSEQLQEYGKVIRK